MSDRVLPALLVLPVVGKVLHDVVVDAAQRQLSLRAGADSHHYQCVVRVSWLLLLRLLLAGAVAITLQLLAVLFLQIVLVFAVGDSLAG